MVSRAMYSMAVGIAFARMIRGTTSRAFSMLSKGTSRLTLRWGRGSSRSTASVTTPSVPSLPTIRSFRL